jgi:hypothetical protein
MAEGAVIGCMPMAMLCFHDGGHPFQAVDQREIWQINALTRDGALLAWMSLPAQMLKQSTTNMSRAFPRAIFHMWCLLLLQARFPGSS